MKFNGVKIGPRDRPPKAEIRVRDHQRISSSESDFMDLIKQEKRQHSREELMKLLQEIDRIGAGLAEDMSLINLKAYRESISRFVNLALKGSYRVNDQKGVDIYGSVRSYKIARQIDRSLEELTKTVLKKHEAQINIVARVSEIRGLLIDLIG